MGFKSLMKKVGKVALKAAPFALDFLPGGQLAHLAIAAGLGAAGAKGGLKSRLIGAGLGAASEEGGHLLGKIGKVGGSGDMAGKRLVDSGGLIGSGIAEAPTNTSSSLLGKFGKFAEKNPMLLLAGASILGGAGKNTSQSKDVTRTGYDPNSFANPEDTMSRALQAVHRSGSAFFERPNRRMSALLPEPSAPVSYAGVQIGGGMHNAAMDPMEIDRSYLGRYDPMQSVGGVDEIRKAQPRRV